MELCITMQRVKCKEALDLFFQDSLMTHLLRHQSMDLEGHVLSHIKSVMSSVPAYGEFMASEGVDTDSIRSLETFSTLPLLTKKNYFNAFPLPRLCRQDALAECSMIATSSGSTGEPLFWPRNTAHELDIARRFEHIFVNSFHSHQRTTLAVVCFPLGNWVGGMYTASCCRYLAQKGYPITLVTPGNKPDEIFRCIEKLGPFYEHVVLLGYPPFLKDVIDKGINQGVDWPQFKVKMVLAGEVFSEEWRSLMAERLGGANVYTDFASLYGTADAGVLGNETPLSVAIRRFLATHPEEARELFGESRLPTLVQYDPLSRYFECIDHSLVVSGESGIPLVRYTIGDKGGIITFNAMSRFLKNCGFDPRSSKALDLTFDYKIKLPFVFVFGRSDFTVSFFGANIYPENISVALEQNDLTTRVSGKFVLEVTESEEQNKQLQVTVELLSGVHGDEALGQKISDSIIIQLRRLNSEFNNYVPEEKQNVNIILKSHGDSDYFPIGVKHRYTRG